MPMAHAAANQVEVDDASVVADRPGTFELPFTIRRAGDLGDGVRLTIATRTGGDNPAVPGEDYTPLPPGTELRLAPGESGGVAVVEVEGRAETSPPKTLLLDVTAARAYHPEPRLDPVARSFRTDGVSRSMTMADLNGNGHMDVVTGNEDSAQISVLLSDGDGGFQAPVNFPVGDVQPSFIAVAAVDVNGNGHVDIIATSFNAHTLYVLAGDGTGHFTAAGSHPVGQMPRSVVAADVNGSGHVDIVTGNYTTNDVSVLLGDGEGGFSPATNWAVGALPEAIMVADVTGNGHLDIISANRESRDITVLEGDGDGAFMVSTLLVPGDGLEPSSLAIADVTGNGHADIVVGHNYSGGGLGHAGMAGSRLSVFEGGAAGAFADPAHWEVGNSRVSWIEVDDVTGNGHPDLVVGQNNTVVVLVGDGTGHFAERFPIPAGYGVAALRMVDIDGDGHLDLVTTNMLSRNVSVIPGDGHGGFGFAGNHFVGESPAGVAVVDLNGDGHLDIVTANASSHDVSVLLGDGAGGFASAVSYASGVSWPAALAIADIDGNGVEDIIVSGFDGVSVLPGVGDGTLGAPVIFAVAPPDRWETPVDVAVADVTGNGHIDIVTANANFENYSVTVLQGDGAGDFADAVIYEVGTEAGQLLYSVLLGDITGNGYLDIATTRGTKDDVFILEGDGSGTFSPWDTMAIAGRPYRVASADVTGSGHSDLISLNHSAHTVAVLSGDGAGGYGDPTYYRVYPSQDDPEYDAWPLDMTVVDVTGDGHLDIVTANSQNHTISVLVNDGTGAFGAPVVFDAGNTPGALAAGDLNGNGNLDLVSANDNSDTVTVFFNALSVVEITGAEAVGTIRFEPLDDLVFGDRFETGSD